MIRSIHRVIILAAVLSSSIDCGAMAVASQHVGLTRSDSSYASQASLAPARFQQADASKRSYSPLLASLSAAPPAVVLVERPTLVDLRQDQGEAGGAQAWFPVPGYQYWNRQTISTDDSFPFENGPTYLRWDCIAFPAWSIVFLSIGLGLAASWAIGRPLRSLSTAFSKVGSEYRPHEFIPERGPKELRRLARVSNELLARRIDSRAEQSSTLVALQLHLESHAARLRDRALQVKEWHKRVALVEDIDLFSHLARQFVEGTQPSIGPRTDLSVEAFIHDRFVMTSSLEANLFVCTFEAGAEFKLPRPVLERVMFNLVDNALEHGIPPIEIKTSRTRAEWILSIRDHGAGITQSRLADATAAFVRLGSADNSGRHWGLGLALVKKLVASAGGHLILGNHPGGGLIARLVFPRSERP
ncbi:HAMP domain-containing sensor histidine kinase [Paraburkholderia caledonica]|uniref:histidine kinase n=1 Tax=Paraburkholderia caledonica TaxID=134536 RepID=A0ABU1KXC7_9BURK|nr:HAMP domain-containing sensor histidine kinase [Paraburkholderia caledonica]MDR6375592.1 signal transduction histidine kinase [Paraburkholderia caledonica]